MARRELLHAAAALLSATIVFVNYPGHGPDLWYLWGSLRLLILGGNPYDTGALTALSEELGGSGAAPVYYPPGMFALLYPLGAVSFPFATTFWMILLVCAAVWLIHTLAAAVSLTCSGGPRSTITIAAVTFSFFPLLQNFYLAQLSLLAVAAFVFFTVTAFNSRASLVSELAAGVSAAAALVKPHLFVLAALASLIHLVKERRFRLLTITGAVVAALHIAAPILLEPGIFSWYFETERQSPFVWMHPTIPGYISKLSGRYDAAVRLAPVALLVVLLPGWWWMRRSSPSLKTVLMVLFPLNLLLLPYGWTYDFVLLLPLIALLAARPEVPPLYAPFVMALSVLLAVGPYGMATHYWFPPAVCLISLIAAYTALSRPKRAGF